jgi:enediyne polyketide synthase
LFQGGRGAMHNRGDDGGPVAIIGVACQFPGAAEPAEFHDLMVAGRRMFRPAAGAPGGPLYAALLDDWVRPTWSGDPAGGTPDTGPVQKLAAETTALALADAGFGDVAEMRRGGDGRRRGGERGGGERRGGDGRRRNPDGMGRRAGGRDGLCDRAGLFLASSVAGVGSLVSEQFGFTADVPQPGAAATSSLHAVAAAAAALGAGDLDLAVAGGAELGLDPAWLTAQARAGTLGRDEMRVYAADPAGRLPGEGCGIVVLARSADARAAGLPVYAEIAGWSTIPVSSSLDGQTVLRAYRQAGIDPADIQFIEGEGTGTAAGDLAELTAFAQLRRGGQVTAALGAAAAGIGYTRAAAGIASLVKTALAMAVGVIPPGPGCARQHPLIESGDALLRLPRRPEPWPDRSAGTSGPRLAAVNSLGTADPAAEPDLYGPREAEGVHLVLGREAEGDRSRGRRRRRTAEEATGPPTTAADPPAARAELTWHSAGRPSVFALCGADASEVAGRLIDLAEDAAALSAGDLRGLARELAADVQRASDRAGPRRAEMVRVALTAATPAQLAARARAAAGRLAAGAAGAAGFTGVAGFRGGAGDPDVYVSVGAGGRGGGVVRRAGRAGVVPVGAAGRLARRAAHAGRAGGHPGRRGGLQPG